MRLLDLQGRWTPDDRAEKQCRGIEFEVPAGTYGVRVELDFDRSRAGVIDLGCQGPDHYVGWSGGAREHYTVSEGWATPGYLPTSLTAGVWQVLLGLHRVPQPDLPFRVRVDTVGRAEVDEERAATTAPDPPGPSRPPRRDLPHLDGMTWRAADFHAHTVHSDGALTVAQLAALAVSRGLDALAVTDHNTTSHHGELPAVGARYGIALVAGQEVTTDRGHANAFGDIGFVDFRRPAAQWQAEVADRGGVLSVNHPLAADCCWQMRLDPPAAIAEIWHSSWLALPAWGGPLAWWQSAGPGTVPIGGSDFHRVGADALPGAPTTWVLAADEDVLAGITAGRTAVSAGRDGPLLLPMGDELTVVGADGALLTGFDRERRPILGDLVSVPAGPGTGPWWLEDGHMRVLALCG